MIELAMTPRIILMDVSVATLRAHPERNAWVLETRGVSYLDVGTATKLWTTGNKVGGDVAQAAPPLFHRPSTFL